MPKQGGGWLSLATWLGLCSRKAVSLNLRETMPEDLVSEGMRRALTVHALAAGLVVHSDQGRQYTATQLENLVAKYGARQSMNRRGNCYDNYRVRLKSFWSRFKPNCSTAEASPVWPKPGPESATSSPTATLNTAIPRSATNRPTTSNPNSKQCPTCVRLSWNTSVFTKLSHFIIVQECDV
ncbi:DDE-type integrase/transposase/recombinase [Hymenobacter rubidus]|uniref:DDE-type integrase/transposase/recombinase n=1 Tax=Hymenobacter rubidus TaxID=1441626 RepID=UPI00191EE3AD